MTHFSSKRAFTIAEVLIGVTVIMVSIVAITRLVLDTIHHNTANMNRLVASQLAQEGMEVVRNMRDSNWVRNLDWLGTNKAPYGDYGALFFQKPLEKKYYYTVDFNPSYPVNGIGQIEALKEDTITDQEVAAKMLPWKLQNIGINDTNFEKGEKIKLYACPQALQKGVSYVHDARAWGCIINQGSSRFSRYISIEMIPAQKAYNDTTNYSKDDVIARVHSIVHWHDGRDLQTVDLTADLTDWRGGPL